MQNFDYKVGLPHENHPIHSLTSQKFQEIIRHLREPDFCWTDVVLTQTGEPLVCHHPQYQPGIMDKLIVCHMGRELGLGVFAKAPISKGAIIGCYAGKISKAMDIDHYTFLSYQTIRLNRLTLKEFLCLQEIVTCSSIIGHATIANYQEVTLNRHQLKLLKSFPIPPEILEKLNHKIYVSANQQSNLSAFIQYAPRFSAATYHPLEQASANIDSLIDEQGVIWLVALRDIDAHEQLTLDYGEDYKKLSLKSFNLQGEVFSENIILFNQRIIQDLFILSANYFDKKEAYVEYSKRFSQTLDFIDKTAAAKFIGAFLTFHPDILKLLYPQDLHFLMDSFHLVVSKHSIEKVGISHEIILDYMEKEIHASSKKNIHLKFNKEKVLSFLKINNPLRFYCYQEPPYPPVSLVAQRHPLHISKTLAKRYIETKNYTLAAEKYELILKLSRDYLTKSHIETCVLNSFSEPEIMMLIEELKGKTPHPLLELCLKKLQTTPREIPTESEIELMLYFLNDSPIKKKIEEYPPILTCQLSFDKHVIHRFMFNQDILLITRDLGNCYYHCALENTPLAKQYLMEARFCYDAVQTMANTLQNEEHRMEAQEMLDRIEENRVCAMSSFI